MSTIASPRGSIALSSQRNSTDTITASSPAPTDRSTTAATTTNRRNRSALRDYYNLQAAAPTSSNPSAEYLPSSATSTTPSDPQDADADADEAENSSTLDLPTFNPSTHITTLLSTSPLQTIWRTEASLSTQIRTLDGEKKALVYDNYAKLIAATETIKKMRERMDPLTPATSTLMPAVGHIAEVAGRLAEGLKGGGGGEGRRGLDGDGDRQEQARTVRWVLGAPERLRGLVDEGKGEVAREEWGAVRGLLGKWEGVGGVEEVRRRCEEVMSGVDGG